jgi:hypothetical protein
LRSPPSAALRRTQPGSRPINRKYERGDRAAHRLRLTDLEARHRLAQYRSHYNPNQPRVPAGNPDGGQWTATGGAGTRLAAADKPRPGRGGIIAIAVQLALRAIEAYRVKERLWDQIAQRNRRHDHRREGCLWGQLRVKRGAVPYCIEWAADVDVPVDAFPDPFLHRLAGR